MRESETQRHKMASGHLKRNFETLNKFNGFSPRARIRHLILSVILCCRVCACVWPMAGLTDPRLLVLFPFFQFQSGLARHERG